MVNVSELTLAVVRFERAQDTVRSYQKVSSRITLAHVWGYTDIALPADLAEPKLSVCQLRGTGQACISLVTTRVSEPQGKPKGVQV